MDQITARTPENTADQWISFIEAGNFDAADDLLEDLPEDDSDFGAAFDAALKAKRPEWHPNGEYDIEIATKGRCKSHEKQAAETYVKIAAADDPARLHSFLVIACFLQGLDIHKLMRAVSDAQPDWVFVFECDPTEAPGPGTCIPREIAEREVARLNAEGSPHVIRTRAECYPALN